MHALCAGIARGAWIPDGAIQPEHLGYVQSFKKWEAAQVKAFRIIEKRYQHSTLSFTGQLDFVITGTDDCTYLVDLKTSARPQKTYPVQMAAYEALLLHHQIKIDGAMIVYLKKDGVFPEIDLLIDMSEEQSVFLSALECHNYFKGKHDRKPKHTSANLGNHGRSTSNSEG